jgi:hypothetical protein
MNIKFYKQTNDKRVISKTLGTAKNKNNCQLEEPSSVINPVITLDIDTSLYSYNYVYIAYFGRYYYIDDITVLDGVRMRISCSVDVLKSFDTQIKNCTVNSRRNENNYDMYLPDDRPVESRYIRYSKNFPKSFNDLRGSYILITVGNGDTNLV